MLETKYASVYHYLQKFVMSLRYGPLFWVVVVPHGRLCCGSGTEGMCIPGGFHHCLSR